MARTNRRRARRRPSSTSKEEELLGDVPPVEEAPALPEQKPSPPAQGAPAPGALPAQVIPDSREVEPSKVLETMKTLVDRMKSGESVDDLNDEITKHVTNQQQRSELIDNLVQSHQYDRLVEHLRIRDRLEKFLFKCIEGNALKPSEALAFLAMVTKESQLIEARVRGGTSAISDLERMLADVDSRIKLDEKTLHEKFAKTSPTSRDLMRRVIHGLKKVSKGKTGS